MTSRIAIVGLACEYPDAHTPWELWENALTQRRSFRPIPRERLGEDYFSSDPAASDQTYGRYAALLTDYTFDRVAHSVSGATYRSTDLTQWLALDVTGRALSEFGHDRLDALSRDRVGVVFGNSLGGEFSRAQVLRLRWPYVRGTVARALSGQGIDHDTLQGYLAAIEADFKTPFADMTSDSLAGGLSNVIAGRICNQFDFHGGGFTIDGACASSLLATIQGAQALERGDLDLAVVGGVDLSLDPFELVGFARASALSPTLMRIYDQRSQGFWPGEGCGVVLLMREEDALRLDCTIYAFVEGWGLSSDGSGGTTRPEQAGQVLALERAYSKAKWSPDTVSFFEGHGTGTPVGDATELAALATARGGHGATPAFVSSIKANIGHTKAAAGLAGLIKTTLGLYQHTIPPITGCENPSSVFGAAAPNLTITREPVECDPASTMRAGVSSMGFGGVNAHVALEAVSARVRRVARGQQPRWATRVPAHSDVGVQASATAQATGQDAELLVFAAEDKQGLLTAVERIADAAPRISMGEVRDLAIGMAAANPRGSARAAVIVSGPHDTADGLNRLCRRIRADEAIHTRHLDPDENVYYAWDAPRARIGLLFPGQAAPTVPDAGALSRRLPGIAEGIEFPAQAQDRRPATEVAQPAIIAASIIGARAIRRLGITADLAIGHSVGEIAALHWAGVIADPTHALGLATDRGNAMADYCSDVAGGMAELRTDPENAMSLIAGLPVVTAAYNTAARTVIAGPADAIAAAIARASQRGVRASPLPVSHAFHSPLMQPAAEPFAAALERLEICDEPTGRVISTVTGRWIDAQSDIRDTLLSQLVAPVRFAEAMATAAAHCDLIIEAGPGLVFAPLAAEASGLPVVSLDVGSQSFAGLLTVTAAAFVGGMEIDLSTLTIGRIQHSREPLAPHSFLSNPCEDVASYTPVPAGMDRGPHPVASTAAVTNEPAAAEESLAAPRSSSRTDGPAGEGAPPSTTETDAPVDPVRVLTEIISVRTELPISAIPESAKLVADLGVNSLTVAEIATEAATCLGVRTGLTPSEMVGATVRELAELLAAGSDDAPAGLIPGVEAWVRSFETRWIPRSVAPTASHRNMRVLFSATSDPELAAACMAHSTEHEASTLVVIGPASRSREAAADFIDLLREATDAGTPRLVVVHGGDSSGPAKCLAYERPELTIVAIGVAECTPQALETLGSVLVDAERGFTEWRISADGEAHVATLLPTAPPHERHEVDLGAADLVLVTGGGRGLGAECAIALARSTRCRLLLVGRTPVSESAEIQQTLARLEELQADAAYVSLDLTDADSVTSTLERLQDQLGPVTAVIHAAGVNNPHSLAELTRQDVTETVRAKVDTLRALMPALGDRLKLLLSFGSIIGRLGMHGEAHYALANEWLAAEVKELAATHPLVTAATLEWSVWSGAGMGERLDVLESLARLGVTPIPMTEGIETFLSLCTHPPAGHDPIVIASRYGQPPTLPDPRRELPILRFLQTPVAVTPQMELISDTELSWVTDPYLGEHMIEGRGLFPAVMGLEAMAQTVLALTGETPAEYRDVSFDAPIFVAADEVVTMRVAALRAAPDVVRLVIRCSSTGFVVDHVTATAVLAAPEAASRDPHSAPVDGGDTGAAIALPPELYADLLFHGDRFQRLEHVHEVHADRMVAHISAPAKSDWFSAFQPRELLLGDPGVRDSFLHSAQLTIPRRRFVPQAAARIRLHHPTHTFDGGLNLVVRQLSYQDDTLLVDVEAHGPDGESVETWEGLALRDLGVIAEPGSWSAVMLGPLMERLLEQAGSGELSAHIGAASDSEELAGETRETALSRAAGETLSTIRRGDGRPEPVLGDGPDVSVSHSDGLVIAATCAAGRVAVDIEAVQQHQPDEWSRLLGADRWAAATAVHTALSEPLDRSATQVWAAGECLFKAGIGRDAPLTLVGAVRDGGREWRSGRARIITTTVRVRGHEGLQACAVLVTPAGPTEAGS